ncbi:flagellar motor switch protein FliM [Novosphingobium fluoreni]|uniref:Flagellar motor switch protein FliM n=1 Tax=Novosphingobium fluoreni TaxID=1391222 RepID=A0A7W6BV55_9SPHN|nr:FliM/FliN family flagellar motor switch protein [uncultured Novosphingobium sp.]MBB3938554.1 flagellar motor switch protein FliM [Novosphingobium fluoreni]
MRPDHSFIVDRVAAQHCAELLGPTTPSVAELAPSLALLSGRLALAFAGGLARLSGTEEPSVRPDAPRTLLASQLGHEAPDLASYAVLGIGPERHQVLLTCAADPVFRLVDRAFGGRGVVPKPLPQSFPLSAELLVQRLEQTLAAALQEALGGALAATPLQRDTRLSQIAPFTPDETVFELSMAVEEPGCEPWVLSLTFPQATLAALFAGRERKLPKLSTPHSPDPMSEPYASLPITLNATVVDMMVPFTRLAALQVGDVIPVAIARQVPLKAGERTIAVGSIGEFEDRVAIQINTAF